MVDTYKPRPQVLQEFIDKLFTSNPMELNLEGNPGAENEYDCEAMSLFSRFNEFGLQCCSDSVVSLDLALNAVQQTFIFWFGEPVYDEARAKKLAIDLLEIFVASYPTHVPEQQP